MEINIFKVGIGKKNFLEFLEEKDLKKLGNSKRISSKIIVNGNTIENKFTSQFFFKIEPSYSEIEWLNYWSSYYKFSSQVTKTVESAYGIIVITTGKETFCISLGRGHHYISNKADLDFGFDVAEIIHDSDNIGAKISRFWGKSKNKAATQYNNNSFVMSEIGESHELVISNIKLKSEYSNFLLNSYISKMQFSSSIKFEISDFTPEQIIHIIHELYYLLLNEVRLFPFPRMTLLKSTNDNKPQIADLNSKILQEIKNCNDSVSLSYLANEFNIFNEMNENGIQLIYERKHYNLETYTLKAISEILKSAKCNDISKVKIYANNNSKEKIELLKIFDFQTEYRDKHYCLYQGRWANFNISYLEFVETEIQKINELSKYDSEFNLNDDCLNEGKRIQLSDTELYDQVNYAEYPFNIFLANKFQYQLLDRKKGQEYYKSVEFADLYDSAKQSLIHVKIGDTDSIRYCIQQSLHSAGILNTQSDVLQVHDIKDIKHISMLFVLSSHRVIVDDEKIDFSKNLSFYFKIEIVEWAYQVRSLGYIPEIIISKDLRPTKKTTKKKQA